MRTNSELFHPRASSTGHGLEPSKFVDNAMWVLKLLQAIFQVIHGDAAKNVSKLLIKLQSKLVCCRPNQTKVLLNFSLKLPKQHVKE